MVVNKQGHSMLVNRWPELCKILGRATQTQILSKSMCLTTAAASIPPFSVGMRLCFSRSRPDVVAEWDPSEVARRWLMLCPLRRDSNRQPEEPTEFELNHIRKDKDKLASIRSRLSELSW